MARSSSRKPAQQLTGLVAVLLASAFVLLGLRDMRPITWGMAVGIPLIFLVSTHMIPRLFPADELLLGMMNALCMLGIVVLYRMDPDTGLQQVMNYAIGLLSMVFCMVLMRVVRHWPMTNMLLGAASLLLMAAPVLIGVERNGAKAWLSLGRISFQPSELVKVGLLLIVSFLLARRQLILSVLFSGACLLLLMLQKDLGTALIYYGVTLVLVFGATRNFFYVGLGAVGAGIGGWIGYNMFSHVRRRARIWIDPWYDYNGAGYQIVQSLIAMVNGGIWGQGLGLGHAHRIPASTTDFIFSVILNEFGLIFGVLVLLLYVLIFLRGVSVAMRSNSRFHTLLALGASALIAFQTFIIIGGNIKMIPLTGVTLPFISYGGTSLLSSMSIMGILQGVASINEDAVLADRELARLQEEYA